jgi:hypothetical protein
MSRTFAIEGMGRFDLLEQKLSMSVVGISPATVAPVNNGELPPPGPEPDPGPLPIDNPPIVLPPLPPSGPVGPG